MAMPRPSGKALEIAKATIPGLKNRELKRACAPKKVPNDEVEMAIVKINEDRGRLK